MGESLVLIFLAGGAKPRDGATYVIAAKLVPCPVPAKHRHGYTPSSSFEAIPPSWVPFLPVNPSFDQLLRVVSEGCSGLSGARDLGLFRLNVWRP